MQTIASDTIRNSSLSIELSTATSYTTIKTLTPPENTSGTIRVSFDCFVNNLGGGATGKCQLFKNDIALGTEYALTTSWVNHVENITTQLNTTDLLQLKGYVGSVPDEVWVRNFQLMYDYADGLPTDTWFHGNYGLLNGELINYVVASSQLGSPQGTITKTNGGVLSNIDNVFYTVAGTATNDSYERFDFTIYNVNYTNSINISVWDGFSGTSTEAVRLGLLNSTSFYSVINETGTLATHLTTFQFNDSTNLTRYSVLDTTLHKLTFSVLIWTYGGSARTVRVDKVQAIVDYDQIPPPLYYDFPLDPDTDAYRMYNNYTSQPVNGAPVVASLVTVNIVPRTNKTSPYNIPINSLTGWWHNDDNLTDVSGNKYNLTWNGSTINYSIGEFNNGTYFNGVNNNASVANKSIFDFERTDAFSIVRWIKRNTTATGYELIGGKRTNGPTEKQGYQLYQREGAIAFSLDNYGSAQSIILEINTSIVNINLSDGNWHMVGARYDGSSSVNGINITVDGITLNNGLAWNTINTLVSGSIKNNASFIWGSRAVNTISFKGWQDEGLIYNRVLTDSEMWVSLYKQRVQQLRVKPDDGITTWSNPWNNYVAYTGGDSPINITTAGTTVNNLLFDVPLNTTQNGIRINDFQRLAWFNATSFITEAESHPCYANNTWADACSEDGINNAITNISGTYNQTIIVAGDIPLSNVINITRPNLTINLTSAQITTPMTGGAFYSTMNDTLIQGGEIIVQNPAIYPAVNYGIFYNNTNNSVVDDVIVRGGNDGIRIVGIGYNNSIKNNSVYNQTDHGIFIRHPYDPNEVNGYFAVNTYCSNDTISGNFAQNQSGHRARSIASEIISCIVFDSNIVEGNPSITGIEGTYFGIMAATNWETTTGYNVNGFALAGQSTNNITIKNSHVNNTRKEAIWSGTNSSDILFENNTVTNVFDDFGMDFDGVHSGIMRNNTVTNTGANGLVVGHNGNYTPSNQTWAQDILFENNTIINPNLRYKNEPTNGAITFLGCLSNCTARNNIIIIDSSSSMANTTASVTYYDTVTNETMWTQYNAPTISNNLAILLVPTTNFSLYNNASNLSSSSMNMVWGTSINGSNVSFNNVGNRIISNISYYNSIWNFSANGTMNSLNTTVQVASPNSNYIFKVDGVQNASETSNSSGYVTFNYTSLWSQHIFQVQQQDVTPPASITNLANTTGSTYINWTWTDPADADFDHVETYLNGAFQNNVTKGLRYFNATGLTPLTQYTIGTHTVDTSGNVNATWVNNTAMTTVAPDVTGTIIAVRQQPAKIYRRI